MAAMVLAIATLLLLALAPRALAQGDAEETTGVAYAGRLTGIGAGRERRCR